MSIRVLEDQVVNRIAAGEVVERPASVVKELLENALDAGPSDLRLELEAGGRRLIRVVDDGCGMPRQDAMLCIERHATSKIRSDQDLQSIATMGFRGEALPSIAAVSRFDLQSRSRGEEEGTRVIIKGGRLESIEACGCPPGTEVTVRDLFFNVPARRRFLRTVATEYGHCLDAVLRLALIRPEIDFCVTHNGRETLRAPRGDSPRRRVARLLGPYGESLKLVRFERGELRVEAWISPVGVHLRSAAGIHLYVNQRYVRDPVLRRAVNDAYRGLVPKGRHPSVVLQLRLPQDRVDVNVHPSKVEVRFRDMRWVQGAVADGLRRGLEEHGLHRPAPALPPRAPSPLPRAEPDSAQRPLPLPSPRAGSAPLPQAARSPSPSPLPPMASEPAPSALPPRSATPGTAGHQLPPPSEPAQPVPAAPPPHAQQEPPPRRPGLSPAERVDALLPVSCFSDLRVIGQLAETYVLCEGAGELVVVDQHAAHERITLQRLQRVRAQGKPIAQTLLQPVLVELPPARAATLEPHRALLSALGLDAEPFGDATWAIKAVPPELTGLDLAQLLRDLADDLADGGHGRPAHEQVERLLSSLACHGSVRAHQRLSVYEMRALLAELDRVDFSVCAHGRPVAIRLDARELEKRFHRS